jgi:hypothetical protein
VVCDIYRRAVRGAKFCELASDNASDADGCWYVHCSLHRRTSYPYNPTHIGEIMADVQPTSTPTEQEIRTQAALGEMQNSMLLLTQRCIMLAGEVAVLRIALDKAQQPKAETAKVPAIGRS